MSRSRTHLGAAPGSRRAARGDGSPLLQTAEHMVRQIEALVHELGAMRAENQALQAELRDAVEMMERASTALGSADGVHLNGRRRSRAATVEAGRSRGRRPARGPARRGRATPAEVTPQVIRATIGKLGPSTAAEIAAAISEAGVQVSGRAVRFLAERAGAQVGVDEDGQRRYRL